MAWRLTAPSHYLNQCRLRISKDIWHLRESILQASAQATILFNAFENYSFKNYYQISQGPVSELTAITALSTKSIIDSMCLPSQTFDTLAFPIYSREISWSFGAATIWWIISMNLKFAGQSDDTETETPKTNKLHWLGCTNTETRNEKFLKRKIWLIHEIVYQMIPLNSYWVNNKYGWFFLGLVYNDIEVSSIMTSCISPESLWRGYFELATPKYNRAEVYQLPFIPATLLVQIWTKFWDKIFEWPSFKRNICVSRIKFDKHNE